MLGDGHPSRSPGGGLGGRRGQDRQCRWWRAGGCRLQGHRSGGGKRRAIVAVFGQCHHDGYRRPRGGHGAFAAERTHREWPGSGYGHRPCQRQGLSLGLEPPATTPRTAASADLGRHALSRNPLRLFFLPGNDAERDFHCAILLFSLKEKVDLASKKTETGADGNLAALLLDNGQVLTEGPVIIQYVVGKEARPTTHKNCGDGASADYSWPTGT
ncbi:protein of unknown function [Acidithiobacillus ferrivorans]|uniref:Uncharacterized protein n=1 Tax=Acidithiobacillus ferrivorans TaxID=160808 RepID=A0A060UR85_9PROT|nr:hypothetical protein AFERRI_150054 [Acidithiobacillus ferrivorans]SMH65620.1 protein of unknown function [Acidithiobacillus ferrivorans]